LLNVDECKTITFLRTRFLVELDWISSINDLRIIMDKTINYSEIWLKRLLRCWDLSENYHSSLVIHTFWSHTSMVLPKLKYYSCVWNPFYDLLEDKVEHVQIWYIRYAPNKHRCACMRFDTLALYNFYIQYSISPNFFLLLI
jgi:hypothetical protein